MVPEGASMLKTSRSILTSLGLLSLLIGCANAQARAGKTEFESKDYFEPNFAVLSARVEAGKAYVSACFDLPSDLDWVLGRLPGDVSISAGPQVIPLSYFELLALREESDSQPARRCDRLVFDMPNGLEQARGTLAIRRLAASLPIDPDWDHLQRRLEDLQTGIIIEPLDGAEGLSFALITRPENMTDLQAHDVVVGIAEPVVVGPWIVPVDFSD